MTFTRQLSITLFSRCPPPRPISPICVEMPIITQPLAPPLNPHPPPRTHTPLPFCWPTTLRFPPDHPRLPRIEGRETPTVPTHTSSGELPSAPRSPPPSAIPFPEHLALLPVLVFGRVSRESPSRRPPRRYPIPLSESDEYIHVETCKGRGATGGKSETSRRAKVPNPTLCYHTPP